MNATIDPMPTAPIASGDNDVSAMNSLLRGELSAVETYEQALAKFEGNSYGHGVTELRRIRDEHQAAVSALTDRIAAHGGTPDKGSGAWGVFTAAVTGAAKAIGPQTVVSALRRGEEHGIGEYDDVLKDSSVSVECKYLIRNELESRCREHIDTLDRLIQQLKQNGK